MILGGPIGAYEEDRYPFLHHELALIGQRVKSGRALPGICLWAQLIARACGASGVDVRSPREATPAVSPLSGEMLREWLELAEAPAHV